MISTSELGYDLVERFVDKLRNKNITIKDNQFLQGRKQFDIRESAEDYLDTLGVNLNMTYDLIKKAKERLQELTTKQPVEHNSIYLPEVAVDLSDDARISFWLRDSIHGNLYKRLAYDLGQPMLLYKGLIPMLSNETIAKVKEVVDRANLTKRENERKVTYEQVIGEWIDNDIKSKASILKTKPVPFTTNPNTPTTLFIDLSPIPETPKETPAWDSVLNRLRFEGMEINAKDYFMAFIWSIFEETDRNRVFLYLYDEGKQGKSVIVHSLEHILGKAIDTFDFLAATTHSTESLVTKRLIVQHEGIIRKLSSHQLVKQITGRDSIRINPKGRTEYTAIIDAKIVVLSNDKPMVSSQLSELSRLLPIKLESRTDKDFTEDFSNVLKEELYDFLSNCRITYNKLKAADREETFLSIDKHLKYNPNYYDYVSMFIETFKERYELQPSVFGSKWKKIQTMINKEIDDDDSFKKNVSSASPKLLDFLAKWAKQHGGEFIRFGNNKGFDKLVLVKKETKDNSKEEALDL